MIVDCLLPIVDIDQFNDDILETIGGSVVVISKVMSPSGLVTVLYRNSIK